MKDDIIDTLQILVSLGDFGQTVHFQGDLACKLEIDGKSVIIRNIPAIFLLFRFFLVYGTPKFDSPGVFMTKMRM